MRSTPNTHTPHTHVNSSSRIARATVISLVAIATLVTACSDAPTSIPPALATVAATPAQRYTIIDLGTLGGSFSNAYDIDNAGRVAGAAAVSGENLHAFLWNHGQMTDIGTLGGPNSEAAGMRELGVASETTDLDPLQEDFCAFGTGFVCTAAVWRNGVLTQLPGLGGLNAIPLSGNTQGTLVGVAEDGTLDASCIAPQKSHFQAVTWSSSAIHVLPPLPGDEVAMALRNNDHGQVVGTSGLCSNTVYGGFALGPHAVLWDNGTAVYLGSLGGTDVGVGVSINNRGEVVGGASTTDGTLHPFYWTRATGMQDLGLMSTDPADAMNTPFQINDHGQMVGASCDPSLGACRGYLWQNHAYTDINDLLPPDAPLYVILPLTINDAGHIAGLAIVKSTGEAHAFLATPVSGNAAGASTAHTATRIAPLSESVRKQLRRKLGVRGR